MTFGGVLSSANQNANIFVVTNGKAVNGFWSSRSVKLECVHGVFVGIMISAVTLTVDICGLVS